MSVTMDDSIKRWTAKRKTALVVEIIQGGHCFETGLAAGFSREQVASIFTDMHSRAEQAFATALDDMPAGFREALFASVGRVFGPRRTNGLVDQET